MTRLEELEASVEAWARVVRECFPDPAIADGVTSDGAAGPGKGA